MPDVLDLDDAHLVHDVGVRWGPLQRTNVFPWRERHGEQDVVRCSIVGSRVLIRTPEICHAIDQETGIVTDLLTHLTQNHPKAPALDGSDRSQAVLSTELNQVAVVREASRQPSHPVADAVAPLLGEDDVAAVLLSDQDDEHRAVRHSAVGVVTHGELEDPFVLQLYRAVDGSMELRRAFVDVVDPEDLLFAGTCQSQLVPRLEIPLSQERIQCSQPLIAVLNAHLKFPARFNEQGTLRIRHVPLLWIVLLI